MSDEFALNKAMTRAAQAQALIENDLLNEALALLLT